MYANWEIIKGLNLRSTYGIDNLAFEDKAFYTALAGDGYSTGGSASNYFRANRRWNWQNTAQYDHTFGEKHNFSLLLGNEQQYSDAERWGATRTSIADPFFTTFQGNFTNIASSGNFQNNNYLVSFFGRVNYNYNRKYLATVNVRRDGYSAWAKKWSNFYGASLGYAISEEDFWKNSPFAQAFDFLKITGSYGSVGNNQGIDDFASLQLYSSGLYGANASFYLAQAGNANLTWETSKKTDVGLSFGFLQGRLQGDFAYYRNLVDGLILNVPQAPSKGIPNGSTGPGTLGNILPANVGSMQNTGVELSLRFNAIRNKAFTWTVGGNVTTLKNRGLSLATQGQRIGTTTSGLGTSNYTEVSHSVGEILAVPSLGVDPATAGACSRKPTARWWSTTTRARPVRARPAGRSWTPTTPPRTARTPRPRRSSSTACTTAPRCPPGTAASTTLLLTGASIWACSFNSRAATTSTTARKPACTTSVSGTTKRISSTTGRPTIPAPSGPG
ncbi:MAG: TonB-dependent receptor domain-containing protein [Janthinobacterium lividum]